MRDVQRETEVRRAARPRPPTGRRARCDRTFRTPGKKRRWPPDALEEGPRWTQGPELLSLFTAPAPIGALSLSPRRKNKARHAGGRARMPIENGGQGGKHGNMFR